MDSRIVSRRDVLGASAALALAPPAGAALSLDTPFVGVVPDGGWTEAIVIVADLRRALEFYTVVAGWQPVARGRTSPELLRLWRLPRAASGTEVLLGNPGDGSGFVRLVQFQDVGPQVQIRSSAMPWDTGGVFSLMTRSRDLDGAYLRAQRLGYSGFNEPTEFNFGGVVLRNVVIRGPDGVNVAIYQRQRPALVGWSTIRKLSLPFNAMQMVRNRDVTRDFYSRVFGYGTLGNAEFLDTVPGPNNFALPENLVTRIPRRYAIMTIASSEVGRVEAMQFVGLDGRDLSNRARFPNYGIVALRYPTRDLQALLVRARGGGSEVSAPIVTTLPSYGHVQIADVRSPDGVLIELMNLTR
jgi:catechol 2,3-dioxygenase-like lactoylglutathione lyase family enzyme